MWVASTHSRAGLIKLERQGWVFMDPAWSMEIGPPEATQVESQGESPRGRDTRRARHWRRATRWSA